MINWHDTRAQIKAVDDFHYDLADLFEELRSLGIDEVNKILNSYEIRVHIDDYQGLKIKIGKE